ncbi:MAG: hypothetical protein RIS36_1957 [Pseudomonadota bacterium]
MNPNRHYANRINAPVLAEQQAEAALRELRERFERAEHNSRDRKVVSEVVGVAWRILTLVGFPDFDEIRQIRTEEWPSVIEPAQHGLVALALETIGWYHFGLHHYDIDRTARIFDRCLELTPHNQRALERFAIIANEIKPEQIGGFAKFPKKQLETALGYKLQCKRKVDNILLDVFGITEGHLVGKGEQTVAQMMKVRKHAERRFVFNILGHLSRFNLAVGDFFGNGTQLSLGIGAACCQLEMLDLPRDISNLITLCKSRLEEVVPQEVAGDETTMLCSILRSLRALCDAKWRIFKNHSSHRRSKEISELLAIIEDV